MTTERDLNELTALLTEPSNALLELAPVKRMTKYLDELDESNSAAKAKSRDAVTGTSRGNWFGLWLPIAAGVVAIFIAGALIGRLFFPVVPEYTGPPRWITAAVDHTNLYTTQTMTSRTLSDEQKTRLLASASQHVEKDLRPTANGTARAVFQNGDLMEFDDKRLVQLNFLYDTGTPFALYILQTPETSDEMSLRDSKFRKGQIDELAAMRWARPGYEYFAVGRLTRDQMDRVAQALSAELDP